MTPETAAHRSRRARFGVFEADLTTGELRKNGVKVRLQEQPFQVLAALLERRGALVTREELRQKLWPGDTYVDFDHGLNTAINKLREALGDSAASPRFVETLARRGYRFIAPLDWMAGDAESAAMPSPLPPAPPEPEASGQTGFGSAELPCPHRGTARALFALAQTMYLAFYVAALAKIERIHDLADVALGGGAAWLVAILIVTAVVGIPTRLYLFCAVLFDYRRAGEKFSRIFALLLPLDELWALAPFLLLHKIGFGWALAATAGLVYLPFSQRTLMRMAYPS